MKDSTMILVVAVILTAAALPAIRTSLHQMARTVDTLEQVSVANQAPAMHAAVSSNRPVQLHSTIGNFRKGWFSL